MSGTIAAIPQQHFEASMADFTTRSRAGWSFWRGVIVGFVSAFPLAQIAVSGQAFGL